jgi:hypothetical protein
MMKSLAKPLWIALLCVSFLTSCHHGVTPETSNSSSSSEPYVPEDPYDEQSFLKAEVGYSYVLPSWLSAKGTSFHVYGPDQKEISADGDGYLLSKRGEGEVTYLEDGTEKTIPLEIVDTEKPMFMPLWTSYSHVDSYPYYIYNSVSTNLNDIFVAHDNSGEMVTTSFYLLFEDTEVVELENGTTFTPKYDLTGKSGYYTCIARAVDSSGNGVSMSQRLDVTESASSLQKTYGNADYIVMNDSGTLDKVMTYSTKEASGTAVKVDFDILVFLDSTTHAYSRILLNDTLFMGYNGSASSMNGAGFTTLSWKHFSLSGKVVADGFNPYSDRTSSRCGLGINFVCMDMSTNDIYLLKNIVVSAA